MGGVSVKSFPPILFKITVKGVEEMNYRIETKDAFRIVGVSVPLHKDIEKKFYSYPSKVAGNLYERNIAEVNRYDGYAAYGSAWHQHL